MVDVIRDAAGYPIRVRTISSSFDTEKSTLQSIVIYVLNVIAMRRRLHGMLPAGSNMRHRGLWTLFSLLSPFIVCAIVPLRPYAPGCWHQNGIRTPVSDVEMSADYRKEIKETFDHYDIAYLEVGDTILVRPIPFLDGNALFDHLNGLLNGEGYLQTGIETWIARTVPGNNPPRITPLGYVYRDPEAFKRLKGGFPTITQVRDCDYVRAIIDAKYWRPATPEELARYNTPAGEPGSLDQPRYVTGRLWYP